MQHVKRYIDTLIFSDQGNWVKDHSKMLTVTFLSLQSVFYLFALITGRSSFMLSTFFFLLILAITFGFVSEIKHPVMQINLTVLSAETLIFSMFGSLFKGLFAGHIGRCIVWLFLQLILMAVGFFIIRHNEKFQDWTQDLQEDGLFNLHSVDTYHPGDIIVGYDPISGAPNIEPLKDRMIHTQVYGPTGSGKTSQVLLPTILRDMQVRSLDSVAYHFDGMGHIILEPNGDLAMQVFSMANVLSGRPAHDVSNPTTLYGKKVYFFDPMLLNSPSFNPLDGSVTQATENIVSAFQAFQSDSSAYFQNLGNNLVRNAMKVAKTVKGNDATLLDLEHLMTNAGGRGEDLVNKFASLPAPNESEDKARQDTVSWFLDDYYSGIKGGANGSKTYQQASGTRDILAKLNSNIYLKKVLNPKSTDKNRLDFNKIFRDGDKVCISTNQGALGQDLSRYLGLFLMLQIQSAIMHRPQPEASRRPSIFYIDEFQTFANPNFEDVLTQGRSYHVGLMLATQTRTLLEEKAGTALLANVATNARTKIVFPGGSPEDAEYFSKLFGSKKVEDVSHSTSQAKGGLFGGSGGKAPTESTSVRENIEPIFTPDQIEFGDQIYAALHKGKDNRQHNIAFYQIVKNGIPQAGKIAQTRFIPFWLHKTLDKNIEWYNANMEVLTDTGTTTTNNQTIINSVLQAEKQAADTSDKPVTDKTDTTPAINTESNDSTNTSAPSPANVVFTAADDNNSNNNNTFNIDFGNLGNMDQSSDIKADTAIQNPDKIDHPVTDTKSDIGATLTKELTDNGKLKSDNNNSNKGKTKKTTKPKPKSDADKTDKANQITMPGSNTNSSESKSDASNIPIPTPDDPPVPSSNPDNNSDANDNPTDMASVPNNADLNSEISDMSDPADLNADIPDIDSIPDMGDLPPDPSEFNSDFDENADSDDDKSSKSKSDIKSDKRNDNKENQQDGSNSNLNSDKDDTPLPSEAPTNLDSATNNSSDPGWKVINW